MVRCLGWLRLGCFSAGGHRQSPTEVGDEPHLKETQLDANPGSGEALSDDQGAQKQTGTVPVPAPGLSSELLQERTLRGLLQKAKYALAQQSKQQQLHAGGGSATDAAAISLHSRLGEAELVRLNARLLEVCSVPRPDASTLASSQSLLSDLRHWLGASPTPASAIAVLYTAGNGIVHAEHAVRSSGQVRFWSPESVSAFVTLLQLYGDILAQAARAGKRAPGQPHPHPHPQQQQQHPLLHVTAALLLRPEWLDLLAEVLELLHFGADYFGSLGAAGRAAAGSAGAGEAQAWALQLWGFLTQVARFAASHADNVQRMEACLQRLASLLMPPSGVVPRLLALPLGEDTLVAQLHALWMLQVLYDMPDAKVLYVGPLAQHYVALHQQHMAAHYEASAADPKSASAELCRIHATLLRSLARHPGGPVRSAFAAARTVEWLLGEMALESQLLPAEHQRAEEEAAAAANSSTSDDDSDDAGSSSLDSSSSSGEEEAGEGAGGGSASRSSRPGSAGAGGDGGDAGTEAGAPSSRSKKSFAYTYDLNEDLERLMALEEEMGCDVELDGFEYDEEGRQLMAKSMARQREHEAAAAAVAAAAARSPLATAELLSTTRNGQSHRYRALSTTVMDPPAGRRPSGGDALSTAAGDLDLDMDTCSLSSARTDGTGCYTSRSNASVPRLALTGLRTASVSSMAGCSGGQLMGLRSSARLGPGASGSGNDPWFTGSQRRSVAGRSARAGVSETGGSTRDTGGVGASEDGAVSAAAAATTGSGSRLRAAGSEGSNPCTQAGEQLQPSSQTARARAVSTGPTTHLGPQGEIHMLVPSKPLGGGGASGRAVLSPAPLPSNGSGRGLPPLSIRPVVPPLRMNTGATGADGAVAPLASTSARNGSVSSRSRQMLILSASNRTHQSQQQHSQSVPGSSDALPDASLQALQSVRLHPPSPVPPQAAQSTIDADAASSPAASSTPLSSSRPVPILNLSSLRRQSNAAAPDPAAARNSSDTGRTVPLGALLCSSECGSLPHGSAMDSSATPPYTAHTAHTHVSRASLMSPSAPGALLQPLREEPSTIHTPPSQPQALHSHGPDPPALCSPRYQDLACKRLLYQDPQTHLLLLKILLDLMVTPLGGLDPGYAPQHPADAGLPHAEYVLLWHLNAPRNSEVVHDLSRAVGRRARQQHQQLLLLPNSLSPQQQQQVGSASSRPSSGSSKSTTARDGSAARVPGLRDSARDHPLAGVGVPGPAPKQAAGPKLISEPSSSSTCSSARAPVLHAAAAAASSSSCAALPGAAPACFAATRPCGASRLLQLLSRQLFDARRYSNLQFVARGAYGDIYRARMEQPPPQQQQEYSPGPGAGAAPQGLAAEASSGAQGLLAAGGGGPQQVVIKTIQLPGTPFDSCVLADVFGEVAIMERFRGCEGICQLLDYGMHDDAYWIVMRRYRCSLAEWRARQRPLAQAQEGPSAELPPPPQDPNTDATTSNTTPAAPPAPPSGASAAAAIAAAAAAVVYLSALQQVVSALQLLASHAVVHFDLKCANVLIEPLPGVRDGELWAPVGTALHSAISGAAAALTTPAAPGAVEAGCVPFRCVIADFGEARAYRSAAEAFTARNRGTEVFKSPEMLMLNTAGRASTSAKPPTHGSSQDPGKTLSPSIATLHSTAAIPHNGAGTGHGAGGVGPSQSRPGSAKAAQQQQVLAGAGLASDVWSLGCLAYELLAGSMLFGGDYASVTHRVAFGAGEHLMLTAAERARLGHLPQLVGLVEWILARDPGNRPSLEAIQERVGRVRGELLAMAVAGGQRGAGEGVGAQVR